MAYKKGESGNLKGKPKGTKAKKTLQWESLGEAISGQQAENYSDLMNELWVGTIEQRLLAADLYLKTVEFFKPKQSRVENSQDGDIKIIVERK